MKLKGLLSIVLLLLTLLPYVPISHASGPTIANSCNSNLGSANTISCTLPVSIGDEIIIAGETQNAVGCASVTATFSTSNPSNAMTLDNSGGSEFVAGNCYFAGIAHGTSSTTTGSMSATFSVSPSAGNTPEISIEAFDITGLSYATINTQSDSVANNGCNPCTTLTDAINSLTNVDATFIVSSIFVQGGGAPAFTGVAGYTKYGPSANVCGLVNSAFFECAEYNFSPSGSTTASTTITQTSGRIVAFRLGVSYGAVTTTTAITPCTFFQLQCWWYPLFFMGLYSGFVLMVGTWLKTSPRGKSHLFLSAVTFGSLVAVIFGIMNIVFPLLMLVLNTIIALRLRG